MSDTYEGALSTPADGPTRTRVARRIAADPVGTALLLAAPSAIDLWPGLRRVGESDGRILVETEVAASRAARARVRALPPRRTPTAFVTRFAWDGPAVPGTSGTLTLAYTADPGGAATGTLATLTLDSEGLPEGLGGSDLREQAGGFLDNLASAAEARSTAA